MDRLEREHPRPISARVVECRRRRVRLRRRRGPRWRRPLRRRTLRLRRRAAAAASSGAAAEWSAAAAAALCCRDEELSLAAARRRAARAAAARRARIARALRAPTWRSIARRRRAAARRAAAVAGGRAPGGGGLGALLGLAGPQPLGVGPRRRRRRDRAALSEAGAVRTAAGDASPPDADRTTATSAPNSRPTAAPMSCGRPLKLVLGRAGRGLAAERADALVGAGRGLRPMDLPPRVLAEPAVCVT